MTKLPLAPFALCALLLAASSPASPTAPARGKFAACGTGPRVDCVVDGDTFWLGGEKIRLADINTPETHQAQCPAEAALGEAAASRLAALLTAGPFTLSLWTDGRERDRYGRLLRVAERDGRSLGEVLVHEGLAERWKGRRSGWC